MSNSQLDSKPLSASSVIVAAPDQVSSELAGESVILNIKTGMYYGLNEVGASIWQLIQKPTTVQAVCEQILQEYDVPPEQCEAEVTRLINELHTAQLIDVKDAATA